ncbi:MAG: carboxypeptidase regulatory-like domain-containing protein [Armatimonadota bacterium]
MRFTILGTLLVFAVALALLAGCSDTDVAPAGNRFQVSGTVTDSSDATLTGVQINVLNQNGIAVGEDTTDAVGDYAIGNLLPGTYSVVAQATVNSIPVRAQSSQFTIVNADVVDLDLTLPTAADLTDVTPPSVNLAALAVFSQDQNGQAVAATVTVSGMADPFGPAVGIIIDNVPPGTHSVTVTGNDQTVTFPQVFFVAGTMTVLNVTLPSSPPADTATITGIVKLSDGEIIGQVPMALLSNGQPVQQITADSEGDFQFTDVAAGQYTIVAQETIDSHPVKTYTAPFTVNEGVDITGFNILMPTTGDLSGIAAPEIDASPLLILAVNENSQYVSVSAVLSGIPTVYGPAAPLPINNILLGTYTVQVTASTGTQTIPNVVIEAATIHVLFLVFPGAPAAT